MPIIGYDVVVKCRLCDAVARARVPLAQEGPVDFMDIMAQFHGEGFESDGGDFLCWHHGWKRRNGAPKPVPSLQREKT